jgi:hypothetical protein
MKDDAPGTGICRQMTFRVWTADILHCS